MSETEMETEIANYEALTPKQQSAVDVLVKHGEDMSITKMEMAEMAGVSDSYLPYVEDNFGQLIEERRKDESVFADGGHAGIDVKFTEDEAFRAMRILPAELSQVVYQAIRKHQPADVQIEAEHNE